MTVAPAHDATRTVMMLDRLKEVMGSDAETARQVGVDPSQLSRWRQGQQPSDPGWDHLVDLFAVVQKMEGFYRPTRLRAWLEGTNAHLGDGSPVYMIRHGRTAEVFSAIAALKSGAFA